MRCISLLAALLATLLLSGPGLAQEQAAPDRATLKRLDGWLRAQVRAAPLAGLSVALQHGSFKWSRGYGLRNLEERLPASAKTSYRYASVTKPMTAVAALRLRELKKLDIDAPIRRYVPYFPKKRWKVTPRHLAGMLAGIPHYVNCDLECHITERYDTERSIGIFKDWPLVHEPGERWMYSSYQFNLLGAALEGATKKPYAEVVRRYVWRPAKMRASQMDDPTVEVDERAAGYRLVGKSLVPSEVIDVSSRFAGGGTRGTVLDMVRFGRALTTGKLLKPESLSVMETPMVTSDGVLTDYGFGIGSYPQAGRWVLSHGGGQPETSTYLAIYPSEDLVIAVATNVEGQRAIVREVADKIVSLLLMDGVLRRQPAGDDAVAALFAEAAYKTFSHGAARYRHWGPERGPLMPLVHAFRELNVLLEPGAMEADPEGIAAVLDLADDPAGGSLFPIVGRHMASTIAQHRGPERVEALLAEDPFAFFLAYEDACLDHDCPTAIRFSSEIAALNRALAKDYAATNTPALARTTLTRKTGLAELQGLLEPLRPARVQPDLSKEIARVASKRVLFAKGQKLDEAKAMLELSAEVFPRSDVAAMAAGEARLVTGDDVGAEQMFERWSSLRAGDDERAKTLRRQARALKRRHSAASSALLGITSRLFPDDVATWDALGKAELKRGRRAEALVAYERAESLSPGDKVRARALAKLRKASGG